MSDTERSDSREAFERAEQKVYKILTAHETNYVQSSETKWTWNCVCGAAETLGYRDAGVEMTRSHWADMIVPEVWQAGHPEVRRDEMSLITKLREANWAELWRDPTDGTLLTREAAWNVVKSRRANPSPSGGEDRAKPQSVSHPQVSGSQSESSPRSLFSSDAGDGVSLPEKHLFVDLAAPKIIEMLAVEGETTPVEGTEPYKVPDTSETLARWIWQHYVGIPITEPYDKEYVRLFDRVEALQRQWFTKGIHEARRQYTAPAKPDAAPPQHTPNCAIHGCEGWNGERVCDCKFDAAERAARRIWTRFVEDYALGDAEPWDDLDLKLLADVAAIIREELGKASHERED